MCFITCQLAIIYCSVLCIIQNQPCHLPCAVTKQDLKYFEEKMLQLVEQQNQMLWSHQQKLEQRIKKLEAKVQRLPANMDQNIQGGVEKAVQDLMV